MKHNVFIGISLSVSIGFIIIGLLLLVGIVLFGPFISLSLKIDPEIAQQLGTIISGLVGTAFGISGSFLIFATFMKQNIDIKKSSIESIFFKFIDYYFINIEQIAILNFEELKNNENQYRNGRSAFITMRIQLFEILKCVKEICQSSRVICTEDNIIDTSFMIFYYGYNEKWTEFICEKISIPMNKEDFVAKFHKKVQIYKHNKMHLGYTNQTFISSYMRNIYNAIKYIDENEILNETEKRQYVKILRAQFSNPELSLLYFNIRSRFGKKWIEHDYIKKYQLFTNIPTGYCQEYDHKKAFPSPEYEYEDDQ